MHPYDPTFAELETSLKGQTDVRQATAMLLQLFVRLIHEAGAGADPTTGAKLRALEETITAKTADLAEAIYVNTPGWGVASSAMEQRNMDQQHRGRRGPGGAADVLPPDGQHPDVPDQRSADQQGRQIPDRSPDQRSADQRRQDEQRGAEGQQAQRNPPVRDPDSRR